MRQFENTPWVARQEQDEESYWTVLDCRGGIVFFGMDEERARLFAAAPDVLFALQAVMGDAEHGQHMSWDERLRIGRDALAKATERAGRKASGGKGWG